MVRVIPTGEFARKEYATEDMAMANRVLKENAKPKGGGSEQC